MKKKNTHTHTQSANKNKNRLAINFWLLPVTKEGNQVSY